MQLGFLQEKPRTLLLYRKVRNKIENLFLNTLFPKECVRCNREGQWLCNQCAIEMPLQETFRCPLCRRISDYGLTCERCMKRGSSLNGLFYMVSYRNRAIQKLIYNFKYHGCESILSDLEKLLHRFVVKFGAIIPSVDVIIPIPLHMRRLQERGYNQAALIAGLLARRTDAEAKDNILKRSSNNIPQTELSHDERSANVQNIFRVYLGECIQDANIMLVDDVYTTGATMQECARVLKEAGARQVYGFVIARG